MVTATNSVSEQSASTVVLVDYSITGLSVENSDPTILGETIYLTATHTTGSYVSYTWKYSYGESGNVQAVSHTYDSIGEYTAT